MATHAYDFEYAVSPPNAKTPFCRRIERVYAFGIRRNDEIAMHCGKATEFVGGVTIRGFPKKNPHSI